MNSRRRWMRTCEGATSVEYAIMASLIALVIFAAVLALGESLPPIFQEVVSGLQ